MGTQVAENFKYEFETFKKPSEIFKVLKEIPEWWSGFYKETILGQSNKISDEFTFHAGEGAHYTRLRVVELVPNKSIVWEVVESQLTFVDDMHEWNGTHIRFDLKENDEMSIVTFTHDGLVPSFQCYNNCSSAWSQYLHQLEEKLN